MRPGEAFVARALNAPRVAAGFRTVSGADTDDDK